MTDTPVHVSAWAKTDVGRTRDHNEDTFLVADLSSGEPLGSSVLASHPVGKRGMLFLVADGMGGAAAGELASAMAADLIFGHLSQVWPSDAETSVERFTYRLREAVELANRHINSYATEHPELRGMGTTATVAGVYHDVLYLAQVGDSRAYLVRNGKAVQITKDQSLMQRLVDAGELTEEEAETSERRNIILQALGPDPQIKVELTHQSLRRGDTLVLCSDGLSGLVKRDEIAASVGGASELPAIAEELIDLANTRGGPDNITVVVARFDGEALELPGRESDAAYQPFPLEELVREATDLDEEEAPAEPLVPPERRTGSPIMIGIALGVFLAVLAMMLMVFL